MTPQSDHPAGSASSLVNGARRHGLAESRRVHVTGRADGSFQFSSGVTTWLQREAGDQRIVAVDLILGALAMCVADAIRSFAEENGVEGLEEVVVGVRGREATPPARLVSADVTIALVGSISDDDAGRLRKVGEHCKIHNTLACGVEVRFSHLEELRSKEADPRGN